MSSSTMSVVGWKRSSVATTRTTTPAPCPAAPAVADAAHVLVTSFRAPPHGHPPDVLGAMGSIQRCERRPSNGPSHISTTMTSSWEGYGDIYNIFRRSGFPMSSKEEEWEWGQWSERFVPRVPERVGKGSGDGGSGGEKGIGEAGRARKGIGSDANRGYIGGGGMGMVQVGGVRDGWAAKFTSPTLRGVRRCGRNGKCFHTSCSLYFERVLAPPFSLVRRTREPSGTRYMSMVEFAQQVLLVAGVKRAGQNCQVGKRCYKGLCRRELRREGRDELGARQLLLRRDGRARANPKILHSVSFLGNEANGMNVQFQVVIQYRKKGDTWYSTLGGQDANLTHSRQRRQREIFHHKTVTLRILQVSTAPCMNEARLLGAYHQMVLPTGLYRNLQSIGVILIIVFETAGATSDDSYMGYGVLQVASPFELRQGTMRLIGSKFMCRNMSAELSFGSTMIWDLVVCVGLSLRIFEFSQNSAYKNQVAITLQGLSTEKNHGEGNNEEMEVI
ncbi:hypothetical protein DFP72DRAFT_857111 [Ephemerocybe angulata]|uniref:Uncharacterized protein n=1 Tax=Ephemerocybe angulata TaxID=980116 RepID=A0A8H6HD82_9AGAR|nr:hypothetical protein DFP72DRAFT_857111 [Tulosesus angulatus]